MQKDERASSLWMKLEKTLNLANAPTVDDYVGISSDRGQCARVDGGPDVPDGNCEIAPLSLPNEVAIADMGCDFLCRFAHGNEGEESKGRWLRRKRTSAHILFEVERHWR